MAIYHLSFKTAAKGKGRSAGAHARYIERQGKYARCRLQEELEYSRSGNLPAWAAGDPLSFWDASDLYERANGRVYSELEIALPREFSREARQELVERFVDQELSGHPYTVAIHNKKALDGGEQPHAHIMFTERQLDGVERGKEQFFKRANDKNPEKGGAKKNRDWNRREKIDEVRLSWEQAVNRALKEQGIDQQLDRRSLAAQGVDRVPEPKMGPERTQMLRDGKSTEISDQVVELRRYRTEEREFQKLKEELKQERARVYDFGERLEKEQEFSFERVGPARKVSGEEKRRYQRVLDLVFTKVELENGHVEYRWNRSNRVAFVDEGDRIRFTNTNETSIKAGIQLAKQKGWEAVKVTGNEAFRREYWIQGQLHGLTVHGYRSTKADELEVERRRAELEQKKEQHRERERERPREQRNERSRSEFGGKEEPTWMKASEVAKEVKEALKHPSREYEQVLQELYTLRPNEEHLTEEGARKAAQSEFSNGRIPQLEQEMTEALKAQEAKVKEHERFTKATGLKGWLPANLKKERAMLKAANAAADTYDGLAKEWESFQREMAKPHNKQAIEHRTRMLHEGALEQQKRRGELEKRKAVLTKQISPYKRLAQKLEELGEHEIRVGRDAKGRLTVSPQEVEQALERLRLKQEKGQSKGRGR